MATTVFHSVGLEFVPNNYAAPLSNENVQEAFHLFQNFLAQSAIGHTLLEPTMLSGSQIKVFWEIGIYDDGGESGTPSIIFEFQEQEFVITPATVRAALGFEDLNAYTISVGDAELQRMMRDIGYSGSLARIGQLKRPLLRKEWSFFFDCITRAFGKKCTNWDVIPIDSLQIGYSLLYSSNFDFARLVLSNIGEKMTENRSVVYFARFCQLIFSACVPGVDIVENDVIPSFKLHKRIFSDLVNKDVKKGNVGELLLPAIVQQFLDNSLQPQPQLQQFQPLNTDPQSTSQRPKSGGRTKHRAFKAVKAAKPSTHTNLPQSVGTSRTKRRANRPRSDANELLQNKRRKLVADYLFDDLVQESTPAEAPEIISQDVTENATVPDESRANADEMADLNDEQPEPILEMQIEENVEAHPSATLEEFDIVDESEDVVAADQPTVIIDESMATHTEVFSVTHQVIEKGEEVDQTTNSVEAAVEPTVEAAVEPIVEAAQATEKINENLNSEHTANEEFVQENVAENVFSSSTKSDDAADSSSSTRVSGQHNPKVTDFGGTSHHDAEAPFKNMYFANWSSHECIFPDQRAAEFVSKSAATITNPELLAHLKATIRSGGYKNQAKQS
ncbi:hypothetical protein POM88_014275 [Heracleum sosnowskyi]|uniref:Uncharacterized protein n=1 Tax=Heracleum sosnowskyi TaxID=360622 RepID=A0AAD8J1M9_9APIA|nr:hypothetical protein POM88_014275 [Heracleum sosnowskyi]